MLNLEPIHHPRQTAAAHPTVDGLQALIFDVDGTLADTEQMHLNAFNHAFTRMGIDWHWDVALYRRLLKISGGKERILYFIHNAEALAVEFGFVSTYHPPLNTTAQHQLIEQIHQLKTQFYTDAAHNEGIPLRPGVLRLLHEAKAQSYRLAIATTTTPENIHALLTPHLGQDWKKWFDCIGDARTAPLQKPHSMVYQQVLAQLNLGAHACLAFEDSGNGLAASSALGIPTLVTPTEFTRHDTFEGAIAVIQDLDHCATLRVTQSHVSCQNQSSDVPFEVDCQTLQRWHSAFIGDA